MSVMRHAQLNGRAGSDEYTHEERHTTGTWKPSVRHRLMDQPVDADHIAYQPFQKVRDRKMYLGCKIAHSSWATSKTQATGARSMREWHPRDGNLSNNLTTNKGETHRGQTFMQTEIAACRSRQTRTLHASKPRTTNHARRIQARLEDKQESRA